MNEVKNTKCTASDIYYRMLQIGSETTENGISLNELKKQLQSECLVTNPQNTEHIEQWFNWAFEHKSFGCNCPTRQSDNNCGCNNHDPCSKYDHDNNCNRFLNKDSIIEFSLLEQSHKQTEQLQLNRQQVNLLQGQLDTLETQIKLAETNASNAKIDSNKAIKYAIAALILTAIFGLPDWIVMYREWSNQTIEQSAKPILELGNIQTLELQQSNQLLDSLVYLHNKQKNSTAYSDSIYLSTNEKILKTLQNINYQLVRLNKQKENE